MGLLEEEKSAYEKILFEGTQGTRRCPKCGTSQDDFEKTGFVGCKECYYTFVSTQAVVEKWQGKCKHTGKTTTSSVSPDVKLATLIKKFKMALERNDLVEAAQLKKEIQILGAGGAKK